MARINSATRPFFAPAKKEGGQAFFEGEVTFGWHSGMGWQVRQRSSDAMRDAILERYASGGLSADEVLEVSTASHDYETRQAPPLQHPGQKLRDLRRLGEARAA